MSKKDYVEGQGEPDQEEVQEEVQEKDFDGDINPEEFEDQEEVQEDLKEVQEEGQQEESGPGDELKKQLNRQIKNQILSAIGAVIGKSRGLEGEELVVYAQSYTQVVDQVHQAIGFDDLVKITDLDEMPDWLKVIIGIGAIPAGAFVAPYMEKYDLNEILGGEL